MFLLIIWQCLLIINVLPDSRRSFYEKNNGMEKTICVPWIMLLGIDNTKESIERNSLSSFVSWMRNIRSVQSRKTVSIISHMSFQRVFLQKPSFYILGKTKLRKQPGWKLGGFLVDTVQEIKPFIGEE